MSKFNKLFNMIMEDTNFKYSDDFEWEDINAYKQPIELKFIEDNADMPKLNWSWICQYQKLPEEFIRKFADKVDWNKISAYQDLSPEFIDEFSEKLNMEIIKNK